jgi:uncharacterized protein YlaN (UPF0358 family)
MQRSYINAKKGFAVTEKVTAEIKKLVRVCADEMTVPEKPRSSKQNRSF